MIAGLQRTFFHFLKELKMTEAPSMSEFRPIRFDQIVGLSSVLPRITNAIKNDRLPNLLFFTGPTGSGKTTLARLVARRKRCLGAAIGDIEPCGTCENCRKPLNDTTCGAEFYNEIDANKLTEARLDEWRFDLLKPHFIIFVDELQELNKALIQQLKKLVEGAVATIILTTTHAEEIQDALRNRLKTYTYELRRPTPDEVVDQFLIPECNRLGVTFDDRGQLTRVAKSLECEMRPCAKFPQQVLAETSDGRITDEFLDALYGTDTKSENTVRRKRALI